MNKGKDLLLVTGATGQQGQAVARELLARGHNVRALTRKPQGDTARSLAAQGAEIAQADLDDPASLTRALAGAWGVFSVQNSWEAGVQREVEQGRRLATLAKAADVQHFVYTSVGSAHRRTGIPHFESKWQIEEAVRAARFPSYTILRPVFFMENWAAGAFRQGIDGGAVAIALRPETRLQMIAVKDIGQYGALAFERRAELAGCEIDIAGDAKTPVEIAAALSRVVGRSLPFVPVPIAQVRAFSEDFALMLEWFDRTGYDADIEGNVRKYGVAPTRFEDWARGVSWS